MFFSRTSSSILTACIVICIFSGTVFAETCTLADPTTSPIQKWKENIDILNGEIWKQAAKSACSVENSNTDPSFTSYMGKVIPFNSAADLMREIYSLSSTGADFYSEVDSFLDPSGPIAELKTQRESIEEIERGIIETARYVGLHCAQSVRIDDDILQGKSGYDTRGRTLSEILIAMTQQTKEVKRFFQILSQGIQTEEYIDEIPFLIAPPGFSEDMYIYFSPKHLQECRDSDPRKKAFWEILKGTFTSGWKYPQAMQVWKDAMSLLLYRGSQLTGLGSYDEEKESRIQSIVQARKGGMGNSDIMINSQFFKEFGYRAASGSVDEKIITQGRKIFYESIGYEFVRKVIPSIVRQGGTDGTGYVKNNQLQEETEKIQRLQEREVSLYDQYSTRSISLSKKNDPELSSELIKNTQVSKENQEALKKTKKIFCDTQKKQAGNRPGAVKCD